LLYLKGHVFMSETVRGTQHEGQEGAGTDSAARILSQGTAEAQSVWPSAEELDAKTVQQLFAPTAADVNAILGPTKETACGCDHPLRLHEHRITYDPPPTRYEGIGRCWATGCQCPAYAETGR
jgi:hypothetical protein